MHEKVSRPQNRIVNGFRTHVSKPCSHELEPLHADLLVPSRLLVLCRILVVCRPRIQRPVLVELAGIHRIVAQAETDMKQQLGSLNLSGM